MKISGLEMEMDLKSSNSFCKILIVSEINYSCCDVRASDIDKYIIDLLEKIQLQIYFVFHIQRTLVMYQTVHLITQIIFLK